MKRLCNTTCNFVAHQMATEEPGHKAMLYFLEVLMNSNGPLTISQLAGRFGSRSFSPEMRSAAGKSCQLMQKFLHDVRFNMAESKTKPHD